MFAPPGSGMIPPGAFTATEPSADLTTLSPTPDFRGWYPLGCRLGGRVASGEWYELQELRWQWPQHRPVQIICIFDGHD